VSLALLSLGKPFIDGTYTQCFGSGSRQPKTGPQKKKEKEEIQNISCLKSLNVLCRGLIKKFQLNFSKCKCCNTSWSGSGMDPYSATGWIRIQFLNTDTKHCFYASSGSATRDSCKGSGMFLPTSIADPEPYFVGPPGSGSVSITQRYGAGSF
jgi:hypothetical protein